jgi:ABC-2 type transport system permease protein
MCPERPRPPSNLHPRSSGWRLFARTVVARAYPRLIMNVREKWWLVFDIVLPLIGLCAYVFIYRANNAPADLIGFVIIGGAMSAYWMNVLWSMGNQLFWEKETGNLALYIMAPNSMMAILLGMALGGMLTTTIRAGSILLVGSLLFDVQFAVERIPLLAMVFVLSLVALYGMGMMFASLFLLFGREGWHLVNLAQEPVFLLSGTFFPIRSFNFWVAAGASIIPLTLALDAIRQLSFASGADMGFLDVRVEVAILAGLCVMFLISARMLLQRLERLAIAEGRLTEARA